MSDVRLEVDQRSTVVIYDERTGQIVHRHEVVTMRGGSHPDERTIEADAREELERSRGESSGRLSGRPEASQRLAALHVDPARVKPDATYRVDVRKRTLVEQ